MRNCLLLPIAVSALYASQLFAQTIPPPPTTTAPTPAPAESLPSAPGYGANQAQPPAAGNSAAPLPQQGPAPSTTPGPATPQEPVKAYVPYGPLDEDKKEPPALSSMYIPVDSWIYPAMLRLYSLGYVDTMFLGMRPWTRLSTLHMLHEAQHDILMDNNQEAVGILNAVLTQLEPEEQHEAHPETMVYGLGSAYTRFMGVGGTTLRDSFHLGQTINNDYGRPYQPGFNNVTGFSAMYEYWRFSLDLRGEFQYAPAAPGYSQALSSDLSARDGILFAPPNAPQDTIPSGPIAAQTNFRLINAALSFHVLGHEISGGKTDAWLGPAQGSSMAWSNNAENIYSFRINRVEPLHVPGLSRVLGPLRYDFFIGSLKGHTHPNEPWVHSEMFSFRPTSNFEFGFQRTIIFGGAGHAPVTLHTFLVGFFSLTDTTPEEKVGREDPGARYSAFNISYRLPLMRKYMSFYLDTIAHDDVTPMSAPRRAAYRTGLYLSKFPGLNKLDMRVEAVSTDPNTGRSIAGTFNYFEGIQLQGYTNKGYIMGDWIGREAKGGQAWLTYHLSGNEWIQLAYLRKKNAKDFDDGTTQDQYKASVVKRFGRDVEMNAWVQFERWKAPVYKTGLQTDTIGAVQLTWYPKLSIHPQIQ